MALIAYVKKNKKQKCLSCCETMSYMLYHILKSNTKKIIG